MSHEHAHGSKEPLQDQRTCRNLERLYFSSLPSVSLGNSMGNSPPAGVGNEVCTSWYSYSFIFQRWRLILESAGVTCSVDLTSLGPYLIIFVRLALSAESSTKYLKLEGIGVGSSGW